MKEILILLKEGLSVWRIYLATRQEAWERKKDRNMRRALTHSAGAFRRLMELDLNIEDKVFLKHKKNFYKYRSK